MEWLLDHVCKAAGVNSVNVPAGVEILHRTNRMSAFVFVLNYSHEKVTVPLEQSGVDLLTGNKVNNSVELEPTGVSIIQLDKTK